MDKLEKYIRSKIDKLVVKYWFTFYVKFTYYVTK
jgi:hypothetical protein